MTRQRVLTGPGADSTERPDPVGFALLHEQPGRSLEPDLSPVVSQDAPTIEQMAVVFETASRNMVKICVMVYRWRSNGGPERDLKNPETWDRYLGAVFGLGASNVRGMFTQGHVFCSLQLQQNSVLTEIRTSHLRALVPLRDDPDLVNEAWVTANEVVAGRDEDRDTKRPGRVTAELLKTEVAAIRSRVGLVPISSMGNRIECSYCSGKGWTYRSAGSPVAGTTGPGC